MTQLMICRGVPASGKTTWARAWVAEEPVWRARINRDDFRQLMYGLPVLDRTQEEAVTAAQHAAVSALLSAKINVVVDDTNLRAQTVKSLCKLAEAAGASVEFKDFEVGVEECIKRDKNREKAVGEKVIRSFAQRYLRNGKLPAIPLHVPDGPISAPLYSPDKSKPRAWIFDVDGTLAHMDDRRGPYDWDKVGEDRLDESVARVLTTIRDSGSDKIIIMSGRDGSCATQTADWLAKHEIDYDALIMRKAGDMRKDSVVKREMFDYYLRDNVWVQAVFDDRASVVRTWRSMGIPCYQVAPGDF